MSIDLSSLPYSEDALEPHIPAETLRVYDGKHHGAGASKLNSPLRGTELADKSLEVIVASYAKPSVTDKEAATILGNAAQTHRRPSHHRRDDAVAEAPVMQTPNTELHAAPGLAEQASAGGPRETVVVKRAREAASIDDGMRVLVDRLWPRGLTKERVAADLWLQDVAPSDALRRWFAHEPSRWLVFSQKYRAELARRPDLLRLLDDLRRSGRLTLLYHAGDAAHNHALVLQQVLSERRFAPPPTHRS